MRASLRAAGWRLAPGYMADRARRFERRWRDERGMTERARRYAETHGPVVAAGPFAGLRYPPELLPRVDAAVPKLSGSYERPLHAATEELVAAGSPFADLGCADGYYAVGMARRGLDVHAFDLSGEARDATRRLAEENGVAVSLHGAADAAAVAALRPRGVLCDIEGAEADVLTAELIARLPGTLFVVELHQAQRPGVVETLGERFAATHDHDLVRQDGAFDEHRDPELVWGVWRPRAAG